ncbi:MAG TPA: FadR/GntR family transcriptional regulator [Devosia sp.]|jgi:DNA-binding FadR family transcriptional regulator|uniref:FadR/GntR family transcriptional regulator n=1 Tax=Devosia sp. TaxID=1871048 RepID=UPI002DDCD0F0|nr:FadR/GntR family transcriptional regulator [Devosia sp.]HEV2515182.1 FadR/GntR family transcriptional regulator [Devosia sp.]
MARSDVTAGPEEYPLTAAERVANELTEIILGELSPGASIPAEADIAARFEVSRLTVREAVKMLVGRGLLHIGRGRRAVVREPDSSVFAALLVSIVRNDPKGLFDLIELRMAMESLSSGLAAKRASRAGVQAIDAAMRDMRASAAEAADGENPEAEARFHESDLQFHEAIAMASGNRVIAFIFEAMAKPLRESFVMSRRGQTLRGAGRVETVEAHQAILDAIRAGDQRAAVEAMRAHLKSTELDIRSHLASGVAAA